MRHVLPTCLCSRKYTSPAALQARIAEVERREAELRDERVNLEVLANRLHNAQTPIARLPEEVLQNIFLWDHYALQCLRNIPQRNACLMSISHRWMVAVSSYAPLWSTISVGLARFHRYFPEQQEQLLDALSIRTRNFVVRSKRAPLCIQIHPGMGDMIRQRLHDCLQRCRRLEMFAFTNTNNDAEQVPLSDRLSNLEDLTIVAHKRRGDDIALPLLPGLAESGCQLKRLTLAGCEYDAQSIQLQIPPITICTTLVFLDISNSMDPHAFSQLLLYCTYVRYVSYTRAAMTALQSVPATSRSVDIYLPYLESLIISGEDDVLRCIARISAPSLVNLEIQRTYNPRPGATTELPLWLAPNRARFPNLRVMKLLHLVEWAPGDLSKFFCTQPALEHFHIISLSTTNVSGLLALADPNVCPDLNALLIQMNLNSLAEDTLTATLERLWIPRRQTHERMRQAQGKKPFVIRVNGQFTPNLGHRIGRLLEVPPSEVGEMIKPYEIPVI